MKSQQILVDYVQQFLKTKDIAVSIPALSHLMDTKINLKVVPQYLPNSPSFQKSQNRYKLIILYIQTLLTSSDLNFTAIDKFMACFNKTIIADIQTMQANETTRANTFKVKEKILFRISEISKRTLIIKKACEKLHDKQDIISFVAIDMKNYLTSMKLITDQYVGIGKSEVLTPMKIDNIYQYQVTSDEDYMNHYTPLLEVLVRLKANMNNLHNQVKNCSRVDMPLKSVNLLANCKNLLMQLQPFLITDKCAFNRLIFHVVTSQTQNMRLISSFYKYQLDFVKSLIFNVFKCVYLGHIFADHYHLIKDKIDSYKKRLIFQIGKIHINIKSQKLTQITNNLKQLQQHLIVINNQILQHQGIICFGDTSILKDYLDQKICKKLSLLLEQKQQVTKLLALIHQANKIVSQVKKIQSEVKSLQTNKVEINKNVEAISKFSVYGAQPQKQMIAQKQLQNKFKATFLVIQQKCIKLSKTQSDFNQFANKYKAKQLFFQHFSHLYGSVDAMKNQYVELQNKLLQSYQQYDRQKQQKQTKIFQTQQEILKQIQKYLLNESKTENGVYSEIGGEILNEDEQCSMLKQHLVNLDKAEFMLKNSSNTQNAQKNIMNLKIYRRFLQKLLIIFEGSMDQDILQPIIDKMDFNEVNQSTITKNVARVNELLTLTQKYNKSLKKIQLQIQMRDKSKDEQKDAESLQLQTSIYNKIYKIVKQRLVLYEIIYTICLQALNVYTELSPKNGKVNYDIETNGVKLFDKPIYQQVLLYYHCYNKIEVVIKQLRDTNLSTKSKNYIQDELLEPYMNRLSSFLKYSSQQMLDLALKLQKAMSIQKGYKSVLKDWQQIVGRPQNRNETIQQYSDKLAEQNEKIMGMGKQINSIIDLSKSKFVILNLQQMKKINQLCQQHLQLAEEIANSSDLSQIGKQKQFKNEKLHEIVKQLNKTFAQQTQ